MEIYLSLLSEIGINETAEAWKEANQISDTDDDTDSNDGVELMPSKPYDYRDDGMPVFLDSQLEWFDPEIAGFFQYEVIENSQCKLALEWADEQLLVKKRIHFYNRKDRFIDLLCRWFNFRQKCTKQVIAICHHMILEPKKIMTSQRGNFIIFKF